MKNLFVLLIAMLVGVSLAVLPGCPVTPTGDDDDDAAEDDDVADDDDTVADDTIYDVQTGGVAEKSTVYLANVVVTSPLSEAPPGFFIQEPGAAENGGIYVYVANGAEADLGSVVVVGNEINITGLYKEYYGLAELELADAADVEVVGTATITPTAVDACAVGTGGADMGAYQSVLVTVSNVTVSSENPDDPDGDFGEFEVESCLRVDDLFFEENPAMGATFSAITGPMYYSYDNAKIEPRDASDLAQ